MKNVPEFEGLRGFLSTLVVVAHLYIPLGQWVWGSMDIFFCMSGFLIGQIILKDYEKRGFIKRYAWRRITRIWPAYYVTFVVCLFLTFLQTRLGHHPTSWPSEIGNVLSLLFLQNTELLFHPGFFYINVSPDYLPSMGHTWSVALEEQFYLLAPIIIFLLARLRRPVLSTAVLAICCCILCSFLRGEGFFWYVLPARFDGFSAGVLAAVIVHQNRILGRTDRSIIPWAWALLVTGGWAVVLLYLLFPLSRLESGASAFASPVVVYGISAVSVFAGGLVLLLNSYTGHVKVAALRWPPLLALGRMSYSTYLAHVPVIWCFGYVLNHLPALSGLQKFIIQLPLCYSAAYVLYILVERPVMQRRGSERSVYAAALPIGESR